MLIKDGGAKTLDLSKIDFETLANRFKKSTMKATELEVLRVAVEAQLNRVMEENPTRTDFGEKFQSLIDEYNSGSRNIEQLFEQLLKLSQSLSGGGSSALYVRALHEMSSLFLTFSRVHPPRYLPTSENL